MYVCICIPPYAPSALFPWKPEKHLPLLQITSITTALIRYCTPPGVEQSYCVFYIKVEDLKSNSYYSSLCVEILQISLKNLN